ncbi:MAG TPA: YciI family protein [Candidatus Limnocylindrales bacterium]|nr:YciI family protein [Candidatus Limnocylindrales bacterium]
MNDRSDRAASESARRTPIEGATGVQPAGSPADVPADVALETIYVIEATYAPDAAELRRPVRAEHLARIAALRDAGVILEGGGFADLSGSLLLVRAPDEAAALEIAWTDVYLRAGVWTEVRCRPFARVVRPGEPSQARPA